MLDGIDSQSEAKRSLERLPKQLHAERPSAIVVVTAHWEGSKVLVSGKEDYPNLFYDYGGFPSYTYQLQYHAPAQPALAARIVKMLTDKGIDSSLDKKRDWDHGVFIPLKVMFPNADIPVVAVSILASWDPAAHIAIGKALTPLRDENILILGSGFATHNFRPQDVKANIAFVQAVTDSISSTNGAEREKILENWTKLPGARSAHAQEDHLMPLHVVVGAAGADAGKEMYNEAVSGGRFVFAHWAFGVADSA